MSRPSAFIRPLPGLVSVLAATLLWAAPTQAHHAFSAEFDADKPLDITGVVTKFKWTNPHSWLYLDVTAPDGTVTNWGVEFGAPNSLEDKGLKKSDIKPGDTIRIVGYRAKNGGPFGYSVTGTLANGRAIQTGGAQDAPGATPAKPQTY